MPGPPKVALLPLPENYALPGRPGGASAAVADCYRQTTFILGEDLVAFAGLLNLHLDALPERQRPKVASDVASLTYVARTYGLLADTCSLLLSGSYVSCIPLLRAALDCVATRIALGGSDGKDYAEWFESAVTREGTATAFDLGRYHSSSPMARDPGLGELYPVLSDLAMPHFGSTLLLAAPEGDAVKVTIGVPDGSFHLGWAELISGWMIDLAGRSLRTLTHQTDDATRDRCEAAVASAMALLDRRPRCHVAEEGGRWVFHDYRRNNRGQPRRILLG